MDAFEKLSNEEVDAIINAAQEQSKDLLGLIQSDPSNQQKSEPDYLLSGLIDGICRECEKNLSSLLRKRIEIKIGSFCLTTLSKILNASNDKKVYSMFQAVPRNHEYGFILCDLNFLHQAINVLFGGHLQKDDIPNHPGKVGIIVGDKAAQICLQSMMQALNEHKKLTCKMIKSSLSPTVTPQMNLADQVHALVLNVWFEDIETHLEFILVESILTLAPANKSVGVATGDKSLDWKTVICSQLLDSEITMQATLAEVEMKVKDFMHLQDGDSITIEDPTQIYLTVNQTKLFKATAGQTNAKRVAKIIGPA